MLICGLLEVGTERRFAGGQVVNFAALHDGVFGAEKCVPQHRSCKKQKGDPTEKEREIEIERERERERGREGERKRET